jgi:hypothetical protein
VRRPGLPHRAFPPRPPAPVRSAGPSLRRTPRPVVPSHRTDHPRRIRPIRRVSDSICNRLHNQGKRHGPSTTSSDPPAGRHQAGRH